MYDFDQYMRTAVNWENMISELKAHGRLSEETKQFADELLSRCVATATVLPVKTTIFRARIMPLERAFDAEPLALDKMGPPPPDLAETGRLSAKGRVTFYGAFDAETALAEVRPWPTARVTIAEFRTATPIRCANLASSRTGSESDVIREWCQFVFSRPVYRTDPSAYLGTQFVAARLIAEGIGGLMYDSRLHPMGTNIALFDPEKVTGQTAVLREIIAISYSDMILAPESARPPRSYAGIGRLIRGK